MNITEIGEKILAARQDKFVELLRSTNREGIENVITWLIEESDFFQAPASTMFHGNYMGGLSEHSMNVYEVAVDLHKMLSQKKGDLLKDVTQESLIIASLLHDVCKANIYKDVVRKRVNALGNWESYKTYNVDYSQFPAGHGEKSVILLLRLGLKMTDDEILAIRWHMTAWDLAFQNAEAKSNLNMAKNQCPLLTIIQCADGIASAMFEEVR